MFFILSKLLPWLVYPLPLVLIGLLAILLFYHRRYARRGLALLLAFFYMLSIPLTVRPFLFWLERRHPAPSALRPHYDVVIVLTGMVHLRHSRPGHIEFNEHVDRILTGISLVRRGIADKLLIVGGSGALFGPGTSEAKLLRTFALEFGLSDAQVLTEEDSRNTYENAVKTADIIRLGQYRDLLLVTSALHMYRAAGAFHKQGLFPDLYPVDFYSVERDMSILDLIPSLRVLTCATYVIREWVGVAVYRLQGYI